MERLRHALRIESSMTVSFSPADLAALFQQPGLGEGDEGIITEAILKESSQAALIAGQERCTRSGDCSMTKAVLMLGQHGVQSETSAAQTVFRCAACSDSWPLETACDILTQHLERFIPPAN